MRKDAVDSQHHERRGQQKRDTAERGQCAVQKMDQDAPGQDGPQAAHDRAVQHVMKVNSSGKPDEQRLDQKSCRREWERKIAVWKIAEGNPVGVFQNIAEVPEDRQPGILPNDNR